jgi:hypothetical protein
VGGLGLPVGGKSHFVVGQADRSLFDLSATSATAN